VLITANGYTGTNIQETTFNQYDWQDREVGTLAPNGVATISTLDNLGEVTESQTYADATDVDGVIETSPGDLRAQTVSDYDSQGQVYESLVYNVAPEYSASPSPGTEGDHLPTDTWRDANGNVLATRTGTGPIEKSLYNGAGELVDSFIVAGELVDSVVETTATADLTYAEATALQSGDIVVQQDQTWQDADGNSIASADYQRFPGDTTTAGALTAANSYVTASVSFYDLAGRDIEDVNYGRQDVVAGSATAFFAYPSGDLIATASNPSVAETTSPPAPDSSADYMVSQTAYIDTAATGPIVDTTDNAGIVTQTQSDLLGRTVRTIQNYVSAGLAANGLPTASDTAEDVTTDSLYDTAGRAAATVAYDATSSSLVPETTVELYESPVNPSLQTNEIDPDSTDNAAAVSVTLAQTSGVATATTASASNYLAGDWVLIQGASDARYNGWFQVASVPSSTTFTYAVPSGTGPSGSGTAQALVAWQHVTGLTWSSSDSGVATVVVANDFAAGQSVSIQGANQAEFNSWFVIASASSTQFTFALSSATVSTATGTIRVRLMNDQTQTSYDVIGEPLTSIDQRGVTHVFTFNTADEETQDNVTSFGTIPAAGQAVNQIDTCYDDTGHVYQVTSKGVVSGSETVLNQVEYAYDGWGDETREWQALTGSVDTLDTPNTPSVQYVYADGAVEGMAQYVRLTDVIYPNVRDIAYGYGQAETPTFAQAVDNIMSRLATISDASDSGLLLADYAYLGANTIASENLDQPQIDLDYSASNFAALDPFGEILNQIWSSYGSASGGSLSSPITLDGYTYGYNAVSDRTSRENLVDAALSEVYGNNSLHELTSMSRGTLSGGAITTPSYTQSWTLDSLGNFSALDDNGTTQNRGVDASNEIQSISGGAATPAYDAAGNMTTTPEPGAPSTGLTCVDDAWDRLVEVSDGSTVWAQYQYDGTGREVAALSSFTVIGGTSYPAAVTYSFYCGQNAIETRSATFTAGDAAPSPQSLAPSYQYVFSALGAKTPLLRDTYVDGTISYNDRLYYLTDANTNVTAVVGLSGSTWAVKERYVYNPYGTVTVCNSGWTLVGYSLADSAVGNTVGFASMSFDAVTGLYYDEARWYSTAVSTFISQDPAQADLNTYRYCRNMPIICVDPSGMAAVAPAPSVREQLDSGAIATNQGTASPISIEMTKKEAQPFITILTVYLRLDVVSSTAVSVYVFSKRRSRRLACGD
jgi:RHS repeat-associated protein